MKTQAQAIKEARYTLAQATQKELCAGSNMYTGIKVIGGKSFATCCSCNRIFTKLIGSGSYAPRHFTGTVAHG